MIKAIILDIDGVIVGDKEGINFPLPHQKVIEKFKDLHAKGMPIVMCTTKIGSSIGDIARKAKLSNPHITDGGSLIINFLNNTIIRKHVIDKEIVKKFTTICLKNDVYIELFTPNDYYLQKSQVADFTDKRSQVIQLEPTIVNSLLEVAGSKDIIKIINFIKDDKDKPKVEEIVRQFGDRITFIWSYNAFLAPVRPSIVTALNISKAEAAKEVVQYLKLSFDEILGIGDSASDWNFMELCKYVATLENGDDKIKELVKTKGEENYFIAPHVNDNGMLDILKHFSISG